MLLKPTHVALSEYIRHFGRPGIFIDVGANVGDFTAMALATGHFSAGIAIEPNPTVFAQLATRFRSGNLVRVTRIAASDREGKAQLNTTSDHTTGSLHRYISSEETPTAFEVPLVPLDQIVSDQSVSLIKIDTQGHDLTVLKGANGIIGRYRPLIQLELIFVPIYEDQSTPTDIIAWLSDRNYVMGGFFDEHYDGANRLAFADAIFLPIERTGPMVPTFHSPPQVEVLQDEIAMLRRVCAERLDLIERLHNELAARQSSAGG
jgi:FkbM family methyltransferase